MLFATAEQLDRLSQLLKPSLIINEKVDETLHKSSYCARQFAARLKQNPAGVAGFCHCRPNDLQPHLVAVDPGGRLDAALKCWSSFDQEAFCLRVRKEADDPKGKYVGT